MIRRLETHGLLVAIWSFAFACVHIAWAAGWRGGLPDSFAPIGERPWFLAYDILAGVLMYGAAIGAILLAFGRGTPLLHKVAFVSSLLALGRGVPALVFDVLGGDFGVVSFGADVWFTVAGLAGFTLVKRIKREQVASRIESREAQYAGH
ncbi:hypothetical protein MU582_00305 [Nocardioidaceae bacterium SCSIO 66511]|nr:hypothetical protein MU582_00305 [Nocardioidaceae bacterium SCSIO 66511]